MLENYTTQEVSDTLALIRDQGVSTWRLRIEKTELFLSALNEGTTPEEYDALRVEHGCVSMLAVIQRKWLDLPERVAASLAGDREIGRHLWGGAW